MFVLKSFLRFFFFLFSTRRLRGESSFGLLHLRKPPYEDIVFLDDTQLKTQNMPFKSIKNDATVLQNRYFYFHMSQKVDGKGFCSPKSTLKTVLSDKKSNAAVAQKGVK